MQENLKRLQLNAQLYEGDATDIASWHDGQKKFDRILIEC